MKTGYQMKTVRRGGAKRKQQQVKKPAAVSISQRYTEILRLRERLIIAQAAEARLQ